MISFDQINEPEDVLGLTSEQVQVLVEYVIKESIRMSPPEGRTSNENSAYLGHRMKLILRCCTNKEDLIFCVVEFLREKIKKNEYVKNIQYVYF